MEENENVNELSLDNVVTDMNTFFSNQDDSEEEVENNESSEEEQNEVTDDQDEDGQESVGSEEENDEDEDSENPDFDGDAGDSSAQFYSSIASALKEDGVLENLSDEDLENIQDANDFKELINKEIESRLDESTKRVSQALSYGMNPPEVIQFENTIHYLDNINPEYLKEESEQAEEMRKRLIYQDYVNKGFEPERAAKMVDKSINAGSDIDDALDALDENKKFFKNGYNNLLNELKKQEKDRQKQLQKQEDELIDTVIKTEEPFEGIKIDKVTRNKVLDNIMKPTVKGEDGQYYTKLQEYQMKYPNEFLHKLGVIFTITDGFKDIDKLIGKRAKKQISKNMRDLEGKLRNQSYKGGSPRYVGNGELNDNGTPKGRFSLDI